MKKFTYEFCTGDCRIMQNHSDGKCNICGHQKKSLDEIAKDVIEWNKSLNKNKSKDVNMCCKEDEFN